MIIPFADTDTYGYASDGYFYPLDHDNMLPLENIVKTMTKPTMGEKVSRVLIAEEEGTHYILSSSCKYPDTIMNHLEEK